MDYSGVVKTVKPSVAVVFSLDQQGNPVGHGTGFVFGHANILVTCNHVLSTDGDTVIRFNGEKLIQASVVIKDVEHDLALLKFTSEAPKIPLKPCREQDILEGMGVIMPGYPLEYVNFATHQGIVSGIAQDATGVTTYTIDGTVNPGNSGGPLLTVDGKVCGVVNAKRRENNKLLQKIEDLGNGTLSIHGIDLVESLQALASNAQLGMGYAVPVSYIPKYRQDIKSQEAKHD